MLTFKAMFYPLNICIICICVSYLSFAGADVYVYKHRDGTILITENSQSENLNYTLEEIRVTRPATSNAPRVRVHEAGSTAPKSTKNLNNTPFDSTIKAISRQYGVDDNLIKAIVMVESAFKSKSISPKGARGLMQLMPATAKRYGVTDSFDPVENLMGGTEYFKYLLGLFNNNIRLALAAYNAGEGAVQHYNGIPPYTETRLYVQKVIHFHRLYTLTNT